TLFCHNLIINDEGVIVDYKLRQQDQKTKAVKALQGLNLQVISAGDSYNDTGMLQQADGGILFCPPQRVIDEFPQFPVARNYEEFKQLFIETRRLIQSRD
ncbi:MAG: bifunctional phosphoserine phosphatase/homoserine phosphotransferase ThrH, partial [Methylophilaceae bacterium]